MPTFREDPAAYMRAHRARKAKQGSRPPRRAASAKPDVIPLGRALTIKERCDDAEMDAIEARGGEPEWDVKRQGWIDAAEPPATRAVAVAPPAPPPPAHALAPTSVHKPPAPPKSMIAIGGRPGRGLAVEDYASPPPAKALALAKAGDAPSGGYALTLAPGYEPMPADWFASVETMLAATASKTDALERRVAALEAQASRSVSWATAFRQAVLVVLGARASGQGV
jgi:hypothetical protein